MTPTTPTPRHLVATLLALLVLVAGAAVSSCSTKKNTGLTRRVQAFKARYNTYYNGHVAFTDGVRSQREAHHDNYTELLPLFITDNKQTAATGSSDFDRAVEKCRKTIKQHSITKRPEWNSNRPKRPKDRIWLSQKEYNPFLHRAWMLMGQAQLRKGDYMEAASTFAYIQRLYATKADVVAEARLLEARCYAALDWTYDAERLVQETRRDSFPTRLEPLRAAVTAACQLRTDTPSIAIPNLRLALGTAGSAMERARIHFLIGQLARQAGDNATAYREFKKVCAGAPPYELEFNARIGQTEVMSSGQSKQMIRRLQAMARNQKNKDYLDQVYYAIGNIHLARADTAAAIAAYAQGVAKSTRGGVDKGVVWLHLGQLYWDTERFAKAQECYAGALSLFDKERADYDAVAERADILGELLPSAQAVELQDSLQELARMDSTARMAVIKRMISELRKKEEEEAREAAERDGANGGQTARANDNGAPSAQPAAGREAGQWYFYNPTAVQAGQREWRKRWGTRELADDWRRADKTVVKDDFEDDAAPQEGADSTATDSTATDSVAQRGGVSATAGDGEGSGDLAADPHRPEYYLKDIPLTEEQMAESNAALADGLYNSAIIYKDRMENFALADRTFQRVLRIVPDYEHADEICYNLFQLYSRQGRTDEAAAQRERLINDFPDNAHAAAVADPNFEVKGRFGRQIEDSLYAEAYDAFQATDYATVERNEAYTGREYPEGRNRARFLFLAALSRLERGDKTQFLADMRGIVEKYPESTVSELAGLYVKGLTEGRLLAGGHMSMGELWARRLGSGGEADSTLADSTFATDRDVPFLFVVAYEHDSIDEHQLLFEVARYNFSHFTVRNFDLTVVPAGGIDMLEVRPFNNYEEAYVYLHGLSNDDEMARRMEGLRLFIISERNLDLLLRGKSFADYFDFYDQHYDRVGHLAVDPASLDEPPLPTLEEIEDMPADGQDTDEGEDEGDEEDFIF